MKQRCMSVLSLALIMEKHLLVPTWIISKGVRRVVCGCIDPFAEVQGRGVKKIREAGDRSDRGCIGERVFRTE